MPAFLRVVVGLDGSKSAANALRWAADRVVDDAAIDVVVAGQQDAVDLAIPSDIKINAIRSSDEPAALALMRAATDVEADAIVVGPHGSGLGRGVGSVTRQLLRCATVPVLVIEDEEPPRSAGVMPPVVACVGYGDPADAAANWAARYAVEQSLPLVLLHSVAYRPVFPLDSGSDLLASYLGTGVAASWARDELTTMANELRAAYPGLEVSTHVESTSVPRAVRRAGENAEVVVLGKRSHEEFLHKIGTPRLRRLVARSQFPTAVVPTAPAP